CLPHPPPLPPLFPYTTLFRSRSVSAAPLLRRTVVIHVSLLDVDVAPPALGALGTVAVLLDRFGDEHDVRVRAVAQLRAAQAAHRSEEHTSELQSRFDLVCRLL